MCGKANVRYPEPLVMNGQKLPWVKTAQHLGHELSQLVDMEQDAKVKRGAFIEKSTEVRHMFKFAEPYQVLQAIQTYTADFYGAMLWDLYGAGAGKVFRSWSTAVKLVWDIPGSTHTYLVDHLLGLGLPSVRQKLLCQYIGFFSNLRRSASWEVRLLSEMTARDAQSVIGRNLLYIKTEFGLSPWSEPVKNFKLRDIRIPLPEIDEWRVAFLTKLLQERRELDICGEDTAEATSLIISLCKS